MSNPLARLSRLVVVLAALVFAGLLPSMPPVAAADTQIAALSAPGAPAARSGAPQQKMSQFRCPGGQLVFLTRACGCNGACCACSGNARYLNHCTCRCESAPTSCSKGHSAGNP